MGGFTGFTGNTAMPSLDSVLNSWWGPGYQSSGLCGIVGSASNIVVGTNPAYTINDFLAIYPNFAGPPSSFTATILDQSNLLSSVTPTGTGNYGTPVSQLGGSGPLGAAGLASGQLITGFGVTPNSVVVGWGGGYGVGPFGGGGYGENSLAMSNPASLPSPNAQVGVPANTTASSNILTGIGNTATAFNNGPLVSGLVVQGPGIPLGTTILSVLSSTSVLLSAAATVTGTAVALGVTLPLDLDPVTVYEAPFAPICVINMYLHLANCCIFEARYQCMWKLAMSLFVNHYLTLYLSGAGQPASSAAQVAAAGLQTGILTSKSVGGVSAGYTNVIPQSWFEMYGNFAMTAAGSSLITLANAVAPHFVYVY